MFRNLSEWVQQARRDKQLYFSALLPAQTITECFAEASRTERSDTVYRLSMVVWMFLSQVLSADHSCRETVARLNAWRAGRNRFGGSAGTGRYCIARDRLNEAGCQRLVETTARQIEDAAPQPWRWQGRRVCVVDGTTVTMPDTPENQQEYPQPSEQQPGCGQPIMRLVVLFSLTTGVVLRSAMAACQGKRTGENTLFREQLSSGLKPGDVLLGDCMFSGWLDIARLQQRGIDVVVHQHQRRHTDFRYGARIGPGDHLIRWSKPSRPEWMSLAEYESLPDVLVMREIRVRVPQRGFRTKELIVVTSLWHHEDYPAHLIAELYRRRWDAELSLRSLKTHLQMEHLRCKKPHRVRNEVRMHLLAYNLIRGAMASSAIQSRQSPWEISFKGTAQTLNQFLPTILAETDIVSWVRRLLEAIGTHQVRNRPNRVEPRVLKRRPKKYKLMNQPRTVLRKSLPANGI